MLKQLYELFISVVTMIQRLQRLEQTVEKQSGRTNELAELVHRLTREQQYAAEREAYERKLLLQEFEIRLLKEKLQLPPQPEKSKDNEDGEK